MVRRRSKTAKEEGAEHLTITQECINDTSGVKEQLTSRLFAATNSNETQLAKLASETMSL